MKKLFLTTIALTAIGVVVRANVKSNYQKSITIDGTTGKIRIEDISKVANNHLASLQIPLI